MESSAPPHASRHSREIDPRPSLERLRDVCLEIFHLAPVGYVTLDLGDRVVEANPAAGAMLGVPPLELRGQPLGLFTPDSAELATHLSEVRDRGVRRATELRLARDEAALFAAQLESVPLPNGEVLTTIVEVGAERDRSPRHELAAAVAEAIAHCADQLRVGLAALADASAPPDVVTRAKELEQVAGRMAGVAPLLVSMISPEASDQAVAEATSRLRAALGKADHDAPRDDLVGPDAPAAEPAPAAAHVLVVEDDELNRRMLGQLLHRRGFDVRLAATVAEAAELSRAMPADVVLGDAHLPDGDIVDLLCAVREHGGERPLIVLSGLGPRMDARVAQALTAPRTSFVPKPTAIEDIVTELRRVLGPTS